MRALRQRLVRSDAWAIWYGGREGGGAAGQGEVAAASGPIAHGVRVRESCTACRGFSRGRKGRAGWRLMQPLFAAVQDVYSLPPQMLHLLGVGFWVVIAAGVIGTVAAGVSIYSNLRRKPSHDEVFATKKELEAAEIRIAAASKAANCELSAQIRAIFSKLDSESRSFQKHASEMERALGRIEGQLTKPV